MHYLIRVWRVQEKMCEMVYVGVCMRMYVCVIDNHA